MFSEQDIVNICGSKTYGNYTFSLKIHYNVNTVYINNKKLCNINEKQLSVHIAPGGYFINKKEVQKDGKVIFEGQFISEEQVKQVINKKHSYDNLKYIIPSIFGILVCFKLLSKTNGVLSK
jgi:hypothetical protein